MSYYDCRNWAPGTPNGHTDCNGYQGPLDTYACLCPCHTDGDDIPAKRATDGAR